MVEVHDIDSPAYWGLMSDWAGGMHECRTTLQGGPVEAHLRDIRRRKSALARKPRQPLMPLPFDEWWELTCEDMPDGTMERAYLRHVTIAGEMKDEVYMLIDGDMQCVGRLVTHPGEKIERMMLQWIRAVDSRKGGG